MGRIVLLSHLEVSLSHPVVPRVPPEVNNIEDCQGDEGVEIGNGEDQMSEFPTAALEYQTPYPFGLDPVRPPPPPSLTFSSKLLLFPDLAGG